MKRRELIATGMAVAALGSARMAQAHDVSDVAGPWTDGGTIRRAGGVINWRSVGEGPVIAVMPKLGGWIADWAPIAPILAEKYRVIAIDPPGHGGSRFPGPVPDVQTLPESAALVRGALHEMGIERYSLGGNSLGGCIAATMGALFPEDVESLTLISVALGPRLSREAIDAAEARKAGDYDSEGHPLPREYGETSRLFGMSMEVHQMQNRSRAQAGKWIRPSERGVALAGLIDEIRKITTPTLLMYGKGTTYEKFREPSLAAIANSTAVMTEAGAFMHQQAPEEVAGHMMPWLAKVL